MILGFFAKSGWGKSYGSQAVIEQNIDHYERVLVLDYSDDYRGLVSAEHGPGWFSHWIAGPLERDKFGRQQWNELIERNKRLVLARHQGQIDNEDWRQICADVIEVARNRDDILVVVDEAHFVAPQRGAVPEPTKGLATTGRGEGASSMWITQRPAEFEETVFGLCNARLIGGLDASDLSKVGSVVEYPQDVHKPGGNSLPNLPESLHTDGEAVSLRKKSDIKPDGTEKVKDSEWIFSNEEGDIERFWSGDRWQPQAEHVGQSGKRIRI